MKKVLILAVLMAAIAVPQIVNADILVEGIFSPLDYIQEFGKGNIVIAGRVAEVVPAQIHISLGRSSTFAKITIDVERSLEGPSGTNEVVYGNNVFYRAEGGGWRATVMPDCEWVSPGDNVLLIVKEFTLLGNSENPAVWKIQKVWFLESGTFGDDAELYDRKTTIDQILWDIHCRDQNSDTPYSALISERIPLGIYIKDVAGILDRKEGGE